MELIEHIRKFIPTRLQHLYEQMLLKKKAGVDRNELLSRAISIKVRNVSYELKSQLINLGCGNTVHKAWDNFDLIPTHALVKPLNILEPLPFEEKTYHACYASHVLEHFPRSYVSQFLSEVYRILKPGGVIRIVVPDFEQQAREYLRQLDLAASGDQSAKVHHEWMIIEIVDQLTRPFSGGFMGRLWSSRPLPAREFIVQRLGQEAEKWLNKLDKEYQSGQLPLDPNEVYGVPPTSMTSEMEFRSKGEVHRWIYDRISMDTLLRNAGFKEIRVCPAEESGIPNFASYHLDIDEQGNTRKPDSLFIEGIT